MGFNLVTDTTAEPVTIDEMKDHLRITDDEENFLITKMMKASRKWCEGYSGRAYMNQTWDIYLDDFPRLPYKVPLPPLQSVTHIKYVNTAGTTTTIGSTEYNVDIYSKPGRIEHTYGYSWPSTTLKTINGVVIRIVCGSATIDAVPEEYKLAVKLLVGHLYEHREETSMERNLERIPFGVETILYMDRLENLP